MVIWRDSARACGRRAGQGYIYSLINFLRPKEGGKQELGTNVQCPQVRWTHVRGGARAADDCNQ